MNIENLKFNRHTITALLFLVVLSMFFIGTSINVSKPIVKSIITKISGANTKEKNEPAKNTQQVSTTANDAEIQKNNSKEQPDKNAAGTKTGSVLSFVDKVITSVETRYDNNIFLRNDLIEMNGGVQLLMNKKIVEDIIKENTVFKMKNGKLTFLYERVDVSQQLSQLKDLYRFIQARNMKMLYVQAPFKVNQLDNQLPYNLEDGTNKNADSLLEGMKSLGIPYLDLRNNIITDELDYDDLFYSTDHHWKIETAFWAYQTAFRFMSDTYEFDFNRQIIEPSDLKKTELPKSFLGSQGKRVGKIYGGVDNFTFFVPNIETHFNVKIINDDGSIKSETVGEFNDTVIKKNPVQSNAPIETNRYAAYIGGDYPLTKIINYNQTNGKLLIIQDSFGLPFSSFMSLNFKETDMIDLRHFKRSSLMEYLESNQYDLVLFLYNPSTIRTEEMFNFGVAQ